MTPPKVGDKVVDSEILFMLSAAFEAYRRDVIVFRNQSSKTEELHNITLKSLLSFIGGDIDIRKLEFSTVREWKVSMEKRHLSPLTIRGYLMKLRVVLGYLDKMRVEALKPDIIVLPKKQYKQIDYLKKEEVALLIESAGKKRRGYAEINRYRNQAIISLLYGSGIRIGEMCKLDRSSIYNETFSVQGKGNKTRLAFVDERTVKYIDTYLSKRKDSNPALFLGNQTQSRIKVGNVQRMIRELGQKAGFKKPIHPHLFRHSFATNLLFNNTNPRYVQALLGHSSLETTQMYMHVVDNDLKDIYLKHHTV